MSLPTKPQFPNSLQSKKLEKFLIPGLIIFILVGVLVAAVLIPKHNDKTNKNGRDTSVFTKSNKVEVEKGKFIEVAPRVKEITPDALYAALTAKEEWIVIQVFDQDNWNDGHIKGSILMGKKEFDQAPDLDKSKTYILVSSDGYDSAEAVTKLVNFGFAYDSTQNLQGGLKAWQDKGYALER